MSDEKDLEKALTEVERALGRRRNPTRHHAREVLVALGRRLIALDEAGEEPGGVDDAVGRLDRALGRPEAREAWEGAVRDELLLACTEHVQSVDPRYLDHPRYDFEYTVAARERLEARLRAASRLDLDPPEELLQRVARADTILEPYLQSRRGTGGLN